MKDIITPIVTWLESNPLELNLKFLKETDRFDNYERAAKEACMAATAEILPASLTDVLPGYGEYGKVCCDNAKTVNDVI